MRYSILILFFLIVSVALSQNREEPVPLSFEDSELPVIFDSLSAITGYFFSYNSDLLPSGNRFTISTDNLVIDQFLSELLVGTGLQYSFFKEQIIINYETPKPAAKRGKRFNLSGTVTDEKGEPLVGANIFLNGTTIGTSSDIDGSFFLDRIPPGYYNLVFSFIGYENAVYNITEDNGGARIQNHQMVQAINQLQEVEVVSERLSSEKEGWANHFQQFVTDLFGTSENANQCTITNPEVLEFTYDEKDMKLEAFASEPIHIVNASMAYHIDYYLESFEHTDQDLRYRGQIKFQSRSSGELSKREIRQERKKNYAGSFNHFKKSLLGNRLRKDGFRVYETKDISRLNIKRMKELDESGLIVFKGDHWELDFENYLVVVYGREKESVNFLRDSRFASVIYGDLNRNTVLVPSKQISLLKLLHGSVRIDLNGQVVDRFAVSTLGYWSWERLANLVPINYDPKFDKFD